MRKGGDGGDGRRMGWDGRRVGWEEEVGWKWNGELGGLVAVGDGEVPMYLVK